MPPRAFRVRTCGIAPLTLALDAEPTLTITSPRARRALDNPATPSSRALPPPPSYGAGYRRLPRGPPSCPLPCLHYLPLSLPVFTHISSSFLSRGRPP
ncbi:hypothetical protein B0H13DRAFT_2065347 [Mycena leptocephala]|nr:hypothetical protein B0H13DRAFT_2065347 [Mycena leptocephala]